ncbi:FAD-linked oxidase C-terminal domain-containing protein [Embleya sp. NPDC005575]|uniref:FAD-binding oxidoreductase n=1 Tax=Embleya sp. NPDC005575 TaxID=3156892 RepID=UPI0033B0AD76
MIRTGGRLWKDVAGYDLTRLLTGSEGTLAVITEITMALCPRPPTSAPAPAPAPAPRTSPAWHTPAVRSPTHSPPASSPLEFLDRRCIGAVEDFAHLGLRTHGGTLLLFGDDGASDAVRRDLARMADLCDRAGASEWTLAEDVAGAEAHPRARRLGDRLPGRIVTTSGGYAAHLASMNRPDRAGPGHRVEADIATARAFVMRASLERPTPRTGPDSRPRPDSRPDSAPVHPGSGPMNGGSYRGNSDISFPGA